jgi:hypothetical protein
MRTQNGLTRKQAQVISELEKLARRAGLRVSAGKLVFAGLRLKQGGCLLRREPWLVLDRLQPFEEQLDVLRRALDGAALAPGVLEGLSDEARAVLAGSG